MKIESMASEEQVLLGRRAVRIEAGSGTETTKLQLHLILQQVDPGGCFRVCGVIPEALERALLGKGGDIASRSDGSHDLRKELLGNKLECRVGETLDEFSATHCDGFSTICRVFVLSFAHFASPARSTSTTT